MIEALQRFIPVLASYPKWLQIFFFAVLFQSLLLAFSLVFWSVRSQAPKKLAPQSTGEDRQEGDDETFDSANPAVALSLSNLATLQAAMGNYREAEESWLKALAIQRRAYGNEHPACGRTLTGLAILYSQAGRLREAEKTQEEAIAILERAYGTEHPEVAVGLNNLASIDLQLADYKKAAPLIQRAINIRLHNLGPSDPSLIPVYENLLAVHKRSGDVAAAKHVEQEIARLKRQSAIKSSTP